MRLGDRLRDLAHSLSKSLIVVPALFGIAGVGLAVLLVAADKVVPGLAERVFPGNTDASRSLLTLLATTTATLAGLVFSVTMLVLQLASSQYSPRVLRTFLHDRNSQATLGVFVGVFGYAFVALRGLDAADDPPALASAAGGILGLLTLVMFVQYVSHMTRKIRVSSIIESVASETRSLMDRTHAEHAAGADMRPSPTGAARELVVDGPGVVTVVDIDRLVGIAAGADGLIEVVPDLGEFVPEGGLLVRAWNLDDDACRLARSAFRLDNERNMVQDLAFGFRQLVDIAERALSPSLNDPTTACQVVDAMHSLLRVLATRPFPSEEVPDDDGILRVRRPVRSWTGYLRLAVEEPTVHGGTSIQLRRRLETMLDDLATVAPADALDEVARLRNEVGRRVGPEPPIAGGERGDTGHRSIRGIRG